MIDKVFSVTGNKITSFIIDEGEGAAVVRMLFELDKPVSPLLFKYLTSVSS